MKRALEEYVERHNRGVRTGDFTALLEALAPTAELRFEGTPVGPFVGRDAIGAAFREHGPDDELVLLDDAGAYAWRARPGVRAGTLRVTAEEGRIVLVVVEAP